LEKTGGNQRIKNEKKVFFTTGACAREKKPLVRAKSGNKIGRTPKKKQSKLGGSREAPRRRGPGPRINRQGVGTRGKETQEGNGGVEGGERPKLKGGLGRSRQIKPVHCEKF